MEEQKNATIQRRKDIENQKQDLAHELSVQDRIVNNLKSDIDKLRREIVQKEKQREALSNKITALIAEKTKSLPSSPAITTLYNNFANNKGNLPCPTSKGSKIERASYR